MREPGSHIAKWNETAAWEPAKAKTRLTKWANAVRVSTTAHGRLATDFERNERRLSMVLVMVNASISSSIFISISDSPLKIYLQVFAGVCSLFAAVLTAWKTELKWAERSEGHRNATRGFVKILHRFAHQLDMIQAKSSRTGKNWRPNRHKSLLLLTISGTERRLTRKLLVKSKKMLDRPKKLDTDQNDIVEAHEVPSRVSSARRR